MAAHLALDGSPLLLPLQAHAARGLAVGDAPACQVAKLSLSVMPSIPSCLLLHTILTQQCRQEPQQGTAPVWPQWG